MTTAMQLVEEFQAKMEALDDPKMCVMLAVCYVDDTYGDPATESGIASIFGGRDAQHRVYGDMLMVLGHEVADKMRYSEPQSNDEIKAMIQALGGAQNGTDKH